MYNHRKTNKGFPNQRVVDHSIKKKVDDKRMKEKCSNSLTFGVGGNGEKKLAKVVWRISCNEHNNNNVGDFSRLFVENKIKINEKQSVFDCCCVVYRAKAGGWRGGGTLREKWKKKNKKKSLFDYGFDLEKWLEGGNEGWEICGVCARIARYRMLQIHLYHLLLRWKYSILTHQATKSLLFLKKLTSILTF